MRDFATAAAEKAAYADHWSFNAGSFDSQGCYDWMASQLDTIAPKTVFDVGCGTGEGVAAVLKRFGCRIVAVDENLDCLRRTHRLLRRNGIPADLRARFGYRQHSDGRHSIRIDQSAVTAAAPVQLVQADVLFNDPAFYSYLEAQAPFDAVTVWLIGAYQCRESCADLVSLQITDPQLYRLRVQNQMYKLASKILRPGGVLHIVDRGEPLATKADEEDHLNSHRDQAALGDLVVQGANSRPYVERATEKGVAMVISPGTSGRVPNITETVMVSVISRKP